MEAGITQDNHALLKLLNQPLKRVIRGCVRDACNFSLMGQCPAKFTLLDRTIAF
jgi:hypothetical protein